MKRTFAMALLFSIITAAHAEIREAPTMADAVSGADAKTLVIFDLDNTVIMPPQTLGGEEWYDYLVEKRTATYEKEGLDAIKAKERAIDESLRDWNRFYSNAKVVAVETDTPKIISDLQAAGTTTMALTGRPGDLGEATDAQLKSVGINMAANTVKSKDRMIPGKNPARFYKGLVLVGPKNNKGEVLSKFLKLTGAKFDKIIFVDNKKHHTEHVETALAALKIPYFGRRHGFADKKIASMDKALVDLQHRYFFGDVLSDADARKLLKK